MSINDPHLEALEILPHQVLQRIGLKYYAYPPNKPVKPLIKRLSVLS